MENKKCVILSQEDYDDLLSLKNKNRIVINSSDIFHNQIKHIYIYIKLENFEILGNIRQRLSSIEKHLQERITEFWQINKSVYLKNKEDIANSIVDSERKAYSRTCEQIANMSYWERRKFLKQWKQK